MKEMKMKLLDQLMQMLDDRDLEDLKSKSPKFAKVSIASDSPSLAEKLKEKMMPSEEMDESPSEESSEEELTPEMLQKLEDLLKGRK